MYLLVLVDIQETVHAQKAIPYAQPILDNPYGIAGVLPVYQ